MERSEKTKNLVLCALFAALTAVGAFIRIPMPVMSFTLQILFTTLAGMLLGGKWGAISVGVYIAMGLMGLPVFLEGGGPSYVLRPSFGYILGFAAGAYVTGKIANAVAAPGFFRLLAAAVAGLAVVYVMGIGYFCIISRFWLGEAVDLRLFLLYYMLPDLAGDVTLCVVAALLAGRLLPRIGRNRG